MRENERPEVTLLVGPGEVRVDARVHETLSNWGAWQQSRSGEAGRRAGSAEGRFRQAPAGPAGAVRVDAARALSVERVVAAPTFPKTAATMLRHHYVYGANWRATSRALGVHWSQYGSEFRKAVTIARNRMGG